MSPRASKASLSCSVVLFFNSLKLVISSPNSFKIWNFFFCCTLYKMFHFLCEKRFIFLRLLGWNFVLWFRGLCFFFWAFFLEHWLVWWLEKHHILFALSKTFTAPKVLCFFCVCLLIKRHMETGAIKKKLQKKKRNK